MRRTLPRCFSYTSARLSTKARNSHPPIVAIDNGTFYRQHPASAGGRDPLANPPLFPGLTFSIPSFSDPIEHWAVLSSSSTARTTFLQILRGELLGEPPTARRYPYLSSDAITEKDLRLRAPATALQYVGFDAQRGGAGGNVGTGAYLSARYESRREETDWSLQDYLLGNTELNASDELVRHPEQSQVQRVISNLRLDSLVDMPVTNLSNGQTRRARIAKALLGSPEVLLLDGPFMGLDPNTTAMLSELLFHLAEARSPRLLLSLRPDDKIPTWISHLICLSADFTAPIQGPKESVLRKLKDLYLEHTGKFESSAEVGLSSLLHTGRTLDENGMFDSLGEVPKMIREPGQKVRESRDGFKINDTANIPEGETLIEMSGVQVAYGPKVVLGGGDGPKPGLWWQLKRGQRWGIFGANGSGKTTLLSLLTSDHPQTYSQPIKLFGRARLPEAGQPGISLFDIQRRIGHSSPEVHSFFPKRISLRQALESAWADAPLAKPLLTYETDNKVDAVLRWFRSDLHPTLGESDTQVIEKFPPLKKPLPLKGYQLERKRELLDMDSLDWADEIRFSELSFSAQRVTLFLRAILAAPDLIILDEAFSGMDEGARDRCMLFLSKGETMVHQSKSKIAGPRRASRSDIDRFGRVKVPGLQDHQALLVVSHRKEEVPGCVREWLCLPEGGSGEIRTGRLFGPLELSESRWETIWGLSPQPTSSSKKSKHRK